ncbi:hypothetical protein [Natrinema pallidum]|uniref:Uncharacterized protein n=2 Tax=Natrinema pallidum TaxID=69527 RepID=L9YK50_9EURY|nr:hypothetical protein [Natrinema pallidum]ELY74494.1 hypothetical protein C487_15069 [Natrinema pallidum DSM 3751]QCW03894.1 hypothetical protein FGF80_11880 [Natrinema pallidum]
MAGTDIPSGGDRGQAYTLEGFIGAMVVLMATLFALQSVVIMPSTGGIDRSDQAQRQQEALDALVVAAEDGNLSETLRRWNGEGGFEGTDGQLAESGDYRQYHPDTFANKSTLGSILDDRFNERGGGYNVEIHPKGSENKTLVHQSGPPPSSVTASYTVTLYDDQYVTPDRERTLSDLNESESAISELSNGPNNPVYNVVEVRVVAW